MEIQAEDKELQELMQLIRQDEDSSPQSESSSATRKRNPRKRPYEEVNINNASKNPSIVRIPRVLNRDLRKKYPIMFINMVNCCDFSLITHFFSLYSQQNASLTKQMSQVSHTAPHLPPQSIASLTLYQNNSLVYFFILISLLLPDRIIIMHNARVITRSDTFKTEIHMYFTVKGTRLFDATPLDVGRFVQSLQQIDHFPHCLTLRDEHYEKAIQRFYQTVPALPEPKPVTANGSFVLTINDFREDLRIDHIQMDSFMDLTHL